MQLVWTKHSLPPKPMEMKRFFWMRRTQLGTGYNQETWTTMESRGGKGGSIPSLRLCVMGKMGILTSFPQGEMGCYVLPECEYSEISVPNAHLHLRTHALIHFEGACLTPGDHCQFLWMVAMLAAEKADASLWVMLSALYITHIWQPLGSTVPKLTIIQVRTQFWNQNGIFHV